MKQKLIKYLLTVSIMFLGFLTMAQEKNITGKIKDNEGIPLPGVNVLIKNTITGTQSNFDGGFTLTAKLNDVIVFSYVGMKTKEIIIGEKSNYDVVLIEDTSKLETVVVVGYGTQKKVDVTGAVSSANLKVFENAPNTNIIQSLQGTVPGLNIGQVNSAGTTPSISIRGQTSLGGNSNVLIVLDGIMYTGSLNSLNPDDIESIDVLKDASSTAVYGAQGANGVLLITTKKGKKNRAPKITLSTSYTTQTPSRNIKPLDREGYINKVRDLFWDEAYLAPNYTELDPSFNPADYLNGVVLDTNGEIPDNDFNWWDAATKTGSITEHKVSITGGSKNTSYLISAAYTNQSGYIINDESKRKNLRANIEINLKEWWTVGMQTFATFIDNSGKEPTLSGIIRHAPLLVPYDEDGELIPFPTTTILANPFMTYHVDDYQKQNYLFGSFYSDIKIPFIDGLSYRINFGNNYRWDKHFYSSVYGSGQTGSAYKNHSSRYDYTLDNILTYKKTFAKKHDISLTLLYGATERQYESTSASGSDYSSLTLSYNSLEQATNPSISSGGWNESLNYQMGRVNYKFKDKYLITATVRRDGFSGFSENEKWGIFPSTSLAWVVTNEKFFKSKIVDFLKLRGGYGSIGNLTNRYFSLSKISRNDAYTFGDGSTTVFGQQLGSLSNTNLQWESTDGINLGVDFRLFKGRITGNAEYYNTETKNQLFSRSIPSITGVSSINVNLGNIRNKGVEFSLTSRNIEIKDFSWSSTLSFSHNKNEILTLTGLDEDEDGQEDDIIADNLFIGQSIGSIYGYEAGSIYQIGDDIPDGYYPGTSRVIDQNGDGEITSDDRIILGKTEPTFRTGLLNTFNYKNLSLNIFLNTVQGGKTGYLKANEPNVGGRQDENAILLNYLDDADFWSPLNPNGMHPRYITSPKVRPKIYQQRNFVRLQDISLAYNFPQNLLDKIGINAAKIFVSGKNLATWTKWKGWDPETGHGLSDSGRPVLKGYSLGFNVTF